MVTQSVNLAFEPGQPGQLVEPGSGHPAGVKGLMERQSSKFLDRDVVMKVPVEPW